MFQSLSFDKAELRLLDLALTFTFFLHRMRFGSDDNKAMASRLSDKIAKARLVPEVYPLYKGGSAFIDARGPNA